MRPQSECYPMNEDLFESIKLRFDAIVSVLPKHPPGQHLFELSRYPSSDGAPHIELHEGRLDYVICERGSEWERRTARDEDELLYWIVTDITHELSFAWAAQHPIPWLSQRRRAFSKEIRLLRRINTAWAKRHAAEHKRILRGLSPEPPR